MKSQTKTIEALADIVVLLSLYFNERGPGNLNDAEQLLLKSLDKLLMDSSPTYSEDDIKELLDVVWHTSLLFKDKPTAGLSQIQQLLITTLHEGGFLTRDPGPELAPSFVPA